MSENGKWTATLRRVRAGAGAALLLAAVAGCATRDDGPARSAAGLTMDEMQTILTDYAGEPGSCPPYIADTTAKPGDLQFCYRSALEASDLMRDVLARLAPKDGLLNQDLGWTIDERAAEVEGCDVDLIRNERPFVYRSSAEAAAPDGSCMFWIMDRFRCNEGSVLVLLAENRALAPAGASQ